MQNNDNDSPISAPAPAETGAREAATLPKGFKHEPRCPTNYDATMFCNCKTNVEPAVVPEAHASALLDEGGCQVSLVTEASMYRKAIARIRENDCVAACAVESYVARIASTARVAYLEAALRKIARGEGRYRRAQHTIDEMSETALAALAGTWESHD